MLRVVALVTYHLSADSTDMPGLLTEKLPGLSPDHGLVWKCLLRQMLSMLPPPTHKRGGGEVVT